MTLHPRLTRACGSPAVALALRKRSRTRAAYAAYVTSGSIWVFGPSAIAAK